MRGATCPLCSIATSRVLATQLRRGTGTVYFCEPCDYGFLVSPEKTDYASAYRQHASHKADGGATNPQELFDVYSKYQAKRLAFVTPHLGSPFDAAVLEIGASAGQFLEHLRGLCGLRCAIEPDQACCDFMSQRGIVTDNKPLRESRFANVKFDVVAAFQTLEHVDDPVRFLRDVRGVLKPQGVAFIEVPNVHEALLSAWELEAYKQFAFHSDHTSYFSAKSLKTIAQRAGFDNVTIDFVQSYQITNTLHWLTNHKAQEDCRGMDEISFKGADEQLAFWLTDTMTRINQMYTNTLIAREQTSDIMMTIRAP